MAAAVCTVALSGCSKTQPEDVPADEPIVVEGDNTLVPIELTTRGKGFVENGNTFAYKLLQKVEECTLYIIEQDKRIMEQDERIRELEKQIENSLK